jgi:four helix bundle protein
VSSGPFDEKPHKRLEVWKKAIDLTVLVYKSTEDFPPTEKFGIVSQMRRAVVSVASNIAEGAARNTRKEFINFLHNAQGSLAELDTQTIISHRLGFLDNENLHTIRQALAQEDKMLTGLIKSLRLKASEM